jgi:flagellar basal body rod protein FlgG
MLLGIYNAATALQVAEQNHEVVSKNLANMNVSGYRRGFLVVEANPDDTSSLDGTSTETTTGDDTGLGAYIATYHIDHTAGPIEHTGRSLDVAISGEGYLVVEGPDGPLYTRHGSMYVGEAGRLIDVMGRSVQGNGGPLTIPPGVSPSQVHISSDGTLSAAGNEIGQLRLVRFDDASLLRRHGSYTFAADETAAPQPSDARVIQGSRESSNVNPVEELVRMTIGMRYYEAAQRALQAMSDSVEQTTSLNVG